jgi:hypothetical protein
VPLLGNSFACYADVGISACFATTPWSRIWPLTPNPFHLAPFNLKTTTSCSWLPHDFTLLNKDTASQMKHQIQGQELKGKLETLPFFSSLISNTTKAWEFWEKILQEICIPDAWHLDSSEELECQLGNQMKPKQISLFCMTSSESIMSILLDLISSKCKPNPRMEKQLALCSKTTSAHEHFSYGNRSPPFHIPSLIMLQKFLELHCSL